MHSRCLLRSSESVLRSFLRPRNGQLRLVTLCTFKSSPLYLQPKRTFITYVSTTFPALLVPPVIFAGLFVSLWIWKCAMMIVWQNRIIYMPGLPPNSRRMRISDYASKNSGVNWKETSTKSSDGTRIALCVAATDARNSTDRLPTYVLYFQGNASSTPPRLPYISPIVRNLGHMSEERRYVFVLLSYRGYWTSEGRPNEDGITHDALAALKWITAQHDSATSIPVVLWGQSIGSGVASTLAANHAESSNSCLRIRSLILETPFTNTRDMLATLYPQKWLPYKYLWPFLRNRLDSMEALRRIAAASQVNKPTITIIEAGNDELVTPEHGASLECLSQQLGLRVERVTVKGALHTEVTDKPAGRAAIINAISGRLDV